MGERHALSIDFLARIPAKWNHFANKDSRQINILEQILVAKGLQLWRDVLFGIGEG
jgi:hypothetical protein